MIKCFDRNIHMLFHFKRARLAWCLINKTTVKNRTILIFNAKKYSKRRISMQNSRHWRIKLVSLFCTHYTFISIMKHAAINISKRLKKNIPILFWWKLWIFLIAKLTDRRKKTFEWQFFIYKKFITVTLMCYVLFFLLFASIY